MALLFRVSRTADNNNTPMLPDMHLLTPSMLPVFAARRAFSPEGVLRYLPRLQVGASVQ